MVTDPTGNYSAGGNMFGFVSNHMINNCLRIPSNTSTFSNQLLTVIGAVNAFDMFHVVISVIYFVSSIEHGGTSAIHIFMAMLVL